MEMFSLENMNIPKKNKKNNVSENESNLIQMKNVELFKKRIMGLTSYFRSVQEELLPKYDKLGDFHIVKIPMSDYQFSIYEQAREKERNEKKFKTKAKIQANNIYNNSEFNSTYRIFSRLFCNFVMPNPPGRPVPFFGEDEDEDLTEQEIIIKNKKKLEKEQENQDKNVKQQPNTREREEDTISDIDEIEGDVVLEKIGNSTYKKKITEVYQFLKDNSAEYLSPEGLQTYSPKFLKILENIYSSDNIGLNLVYSQFRTLEGIGIFMLVLEQNGFTQFKIKKNQIGEWELNIKDEDLRFPMFALFTGTEEEKEKDIIRSIYNSDWNTAYVPEKILNKLKTISNNNNYGEIIKVLMITASGSEGINLRNTRYVHIMEPYWHPVRTEQVIGRARRICSHKDLPKELQTVDVFLYLMTFTQEQLKSDFSIELRLIDVSKKDLKTPLTSDEALYEISLIKQVFSGQIIKAIKESSIDCVVYGKSNKKEGLNCLKFSNPDKTTFSYKPNIENDEKDDNLKRNIEEITWTGTIIRLNDSDYIINKETKEIYDFESYQNGFPILLGKLIQMGDKVKFKRF
jgi:hypothetical protein